VSPHAVVTSSLKVMFTADKEQAEAARRPFSITNCWHQVADPISLLGQPRQGLDLLVVDDAAVELDVGSAVLVCPEQIPLPESRAVG
jgi:hypothetical protein